MTIVVGGRGTIPSEPGLGLMFGAKSVINPKGLYQGRDEGEGQSGRRHPVHRPGQKPLHRQVVSSATKMYTPPLE